MDLKFELIQIFGVFWRGKGTLIGPRESKKTWWGYLPPEKVFQNTN